MTAYNIFDGIFCSKFESIFYSEVNLGFLFGEISNVEKKPIYSFFFLKRKPISALPCQITRLEIMDWDKFLNLNFMELTVKWKGAKIYRRARDFEPRQLREVTQFSPKLLNLYFDLNPLAMTDELQLTQTIFAQKQKLNF